MAESPSGPPLALQRGSPTNVLLKRRAHEKITHEVWESDKGDGSSWTADMKAYKIAWVKPPGGKYGLGTEHKLPRVHCEQCQRAWGDCMFEYPAFELDFVK